MVITIGSNQSIEEKVKINCFALLLIVVVQALSILLLNALVASFAEQLGTFSGIRAVLFTIVILICICVDLFFLYNRIILLKKLVNIKPMKCKIEDIFYIAYTEDERTRYSPYPIVRSMENGKLYFTYDRYSLIRFNTSSTYQSNQMVNAAIYRKGRVPVRLGDTVDLYLLKTIDLPVTIQREKNMVKLKNQKIRFLHMNEKIGIDIFQEIIFFKGIIDVK